jgi:hypothetical protein
MGIETFGIFNTRHAHALVMSSLALAPEDQKQGGLNLDNAKAAMQWDLWNPWAGYYELFSTHPLIAKRIGHLANQAEAEGIHPLIEFDLQRPESFWDEFAMDVLMNFLPFLGIILSGITGFFFKASGSSLWGFLLLGFGLGFLGRVLFSYSSRQFPGCTVAGLLKQIEVSNIRPLSCTVNGRIIGKGIPGLLWSEDFVVQDRTGFIFINYSQPFRFFDFLFGLFETPDLIGKEVTFRGWYRRAPVPFIELYDLAVEKHGSLARHVSYVYHFKRILAIACIVAGLLLMAVG